MARLNYKWASGLGADGNPVYASANVIEVNGRKVYNPKDVHYAASGRYMEVFANPPSDPAPEGKHWEPRGWKIDPESATADMIVRVYVAVDDPPPPPRVFETADLVEALMAEGIWTDVRSWIETQGLLDLVLATKEFDENNENFKAGRAALQQALGWTDEDVEELLAKCVKEGV